MMRFLLQNISPVIALLLAYRYTSLTATAKVAATRVISERAYLISGNSEGSFYSLCAGYFFASSDRQQDNNTADTEIDYWHWPLSFFYSPIQSFGHLVDDYRFLAASQDVRLQRIRIAMAWLHVAGILLAILVMMMHWGVFGRRRERISNTENCAVEDLRRRQGTQQLRTQDSDAAIGFASMQLATNRALANPPFDYLKFRSRELIERAMSLWVRSIVIAFHSYGKVRTVKELTCA